MQVRKRVRSFVRAARCRALVALWLVSAVFVASAQAPTLFAQGEKLFLENKPREASALLERATRESPQEAKAWLYLGICYQQLGQYDDAIATFRKGLPSAAQLSHLFHFNMANSYFSQGKNAFAEEMYGEAIKERPDWAPPFLNRANARMAQGNYKDAVSDYTVYLSLNPSSPQAESIRKVLALLGQAEATEAAKVAAAEAKRLADEQAHQAMLDAVAQSLRENAGDSTSMSAGSEELPGYTQESTLED